jgi:transposase
VGAGRPTKLTPELQDDLVVLLAAGSPVGLAARTVGVSRRSVVRWLRGRGLRERVDQARSDGREHTDAVTEARLVTLIARTASTDWTAASWLLERQFPERWSRDHAPIADEFDEADD